MRLALRRRCGFCQITLASCYLRITVAVQHLSRETTIAAANGRSYPALDVFAHALRYFRHHALQELADQTSTTLLDDDVRWVITVPAIWRPPARQFMRLAAVQVPTCLVCVCIFAVISRPPEARQLVIYVNHHNKGYLRKTPIDWLCGDDAAFVKLLWPLVIGWLVYAVH